MHTLMHSLPPTTNPRFYFDISMEGKRLGRVIIEVQPSIAPKMSQNFNQLVTGERGFGYKGCQFFQAWRNESVICGDWEHNSGRGGRAAIEGGPLFTPDDTRLPCIRGAVGMRRMSKKHSSLNQVTYFLKRYGNCKHLITYFTTKLKDKGNRPLVIEFNSQSKTRLLGCPKGMKKYQYKKWCKEKAVEILKSRKSDKEDKFIKKLEVTKKADDMGDAICQLHAWKMVLDGEAIKVPKPVSRYS